MSLEILNFNALNEIVGSIAIDTVTINLILRKRE